ncbi:MAG: hypothetical protein KJN79_07055, partial [Gammaproteobacteria bacterium]|nr:hypothetical protein [Gammaproteobacteria bacterium]
AQGRNDNIRAERQPFADTNRRGCVVETDDKQGHVGLGCTEIEGKFWDIKGLNASVRSWTPPAE